MYSEGLLEWYCTRGVFSWPLHDIAITNMTWCMA